MERRRQRVSVKYEAKMLCPGMAQRDAKAREDRKQDKRYCIALGQSYSRDADIANNRKIKMHERWPAPSP